MNLHETAMGQRFFNVQLPALINTLKDIAAALSRPAPSAISFPADQHFLISFYLLPVRKPLIYRGFRLSLDFLYALFTPFFCNWRRSLLKLAYGIYQ